MIGNIRTPERGYHRPAKHFAPQIRTQWVRAFDGRSFCVGLGWELKDEERKIQSVLRSLANRENNTGADSRINVRNTYLPSMLAGYKTGMARQMRAMSLESIAP